MDSEFPDTFAANFAHLARNRPTSIALWFADRSWDFQALWQTASVAAVTLRQSGVGRGDRVGLFIGNRPEWLFWAIAIAELGGVIVPINPAYTAAEIRALLGHADLHLLIMDERLGVTADLDGGQAAAGLRLSCAIDGRATAQASSPQSTSPAQPEDPAIIYFSSGSTGQPKGIVHSHRNLVRVADISRNNAMLRQGDGILIAMPLAFAFASTVSWLAAARAGSCVFLQERFKSEAVIEAIGEGKITVTLGVPSMYRTLVQTAAARGPIGGALRVCLSGGDMLTPELATAVEDNLGCRIFDLYGLSETPYILAHTPGVDARSRPYSCGRPMPGVEVRLVDEVGDEVSIGDVGELLVRTPFTFNEYFRDTAATVAAFSAGWFVTGDLLRRDEDGFFYVVDRKKALIKRSGFNVIPAEVEAAIRALPGVDDVAVVGAADDFLGQRVKAFVVPDGTATLLAADVIAGCGETLAKYKVPDDVVFLQELPKGATGKVLKKNLR